MPPYLGDVIASPLPPTPDELGRIMAGDQQCCRDLIDRWESPITAIATGYSSRPSDLDDLIQVGRIAVYRAALNYKGTFESPFGNYAKRAIKNMVMKEAVRLARQRRCETPLEVEAEVGEYPLGWEVGPGPDDPVKDWVRDLPEPHATIFRLLYIEGLRQRPAALQMGVSQPRVAQLHVSFLDLARAALTG